MVIITTIHLRVFTIIITIIILKIALIAVSIVKITILLLQSNQSYALIKNLNPARFSFKNFNTQNCSLRRNFSGNSAGNNSISNNNNNIRKAINESCFSNKEGNNNMADAKSQRELKLISASEKEMFKKLSIKHLSNINLNLNINNIPIGSKRSSLKTLNFKAKNSSLNNS